MVFLIPREMVYIKWYINSIVIMILQVVVGLFFSSMVGYGLAKYRFKGRNIIFLLVLVVMMVPMEITMTFCCPVL